MRYALAIGLDWVERRPVRKVGAYVALAALNDRPARYGTRMGGSW